jgi:hypothetical protein
MPDNEEDLRHDPVKALALVKAAMAQARGQPAPSREEWLQFIMWPIYMGRPRVQEKEPGERGPKFKKTQYDLAHERRRNLYRKLVKLPAQGRAKSWQARPYYVAALSAVLADKAVPSNRKASEVLHLLARHGQQAPTEQTVRRHLAALKECDPGN